MRVIAGRREVEQNKTYVSHKKMDGPTFLNLNNNFHLF